MKSLNGAGRSRASVSWVSAWRRSELTGPGPAGERSTAAGGRRFRVHVWLMLVPALTVSTTQTSVNNNLFVCHVRHCITRPMLHRNCLTYHHHHAFFSCTMLARSFYFYTTKHFCEIRMGSPLCPPPTEHQISRFSVKSADRKEWWHKCFLPLKLPPCEKLSPVKFMLPLRLPWGLSVPQLVRFTTSE